MKDSTTPTKYIFVTGGVVSSLGKGITAASIGRLLVERGLRVTIQKFDPYINVDPGTMSPFQHGEVYVTDDGAETDLDSSTLRSTRHGFRPSTSTRDVLSGYHLRGTWPESTLEWTTNVVCTRRQPTRSCAMLLTCATP